MAGQSSRSVAKEMTNLRPPHTHTGRAKAALSLERQIQEADRVIRGFESTLAQEAPIPAGPGALQERVNELQVRGWPASWREGSQPEQSFRGRGGVDMWNCGTMRVHLAVSLPPPAPAKGVAGATGLRAGAAPRAEGHRACVLRATEQFPRVLPRPVASAAPGAGPY